MIPMEPYYTVLRLPQEEESEFVLMLPFTLNQKDNMVAWMVARSDGDHYGQLLIYQFPKGELVYGPAQIEARIDQDTRISQQLTLWSQRGSRVIRGNLLVLPVNGSILYVEPLYLQAEQSPLPELARVIVAYGDQVVMEETFEAALAAIFGLQPGDTPVDPDAPDTPADPGNKGVAELIVRATELFAAAQNALKEGNWSEYGRLQAELETILSRLLELTVPVQP